MSQTPALACAKKPVHDVALHLMPFHIAYTGPAPISTYLMVKDAPPSTSQDDATMEADGVTTLPDDPSSTENTQVSESPDVATDTPTARDESQTSIASSSTLVNVSQATLSTSFSHLERSSSGLGLVKDLVTNAGKRFIAAFRGRKIQGLRVDVPPGYSGFILGVEGEAEECTDAAQAGNKRKRPEAEEPAKAKKAPKTIKPTKKRSTRGKGRKAEEQVDTSQDEKAEDADSVHDEPMQDVHDAPSRLDANPDSDKAMRVLVPTGTFSSLMVWNGDNAVDPTGDEYIRAMDEWPRMAALIHRV